MATEILRKKLPPNMRSDFWNDFIDVIEEESETVKTEISDKSTYYDIDTMSYERMLELSSLLGVPFDVSLTDDIEFLRKEIKAIPFKIKWKATTLLYLSFFKALSDEGLIYLYYWNTSDLIRDTENLLNYTTGIDVSAPYYHHSTMNFTSVIAEEKRLDEGLKLDESWYLDSKTSQINTNHLAVEFFLNKTVISDEKEYLMLPACFSFIKTNMEVYKKATEVIHIGCQLGAITDNSTYYNTSGLEYTMPDIKLNAVSTSNLATITNIAEISYMTFGIGTLTDLPSTKGTGTSPTALNEKVAKMEILSEEQYSNDDWYGVNAEYIGNLINDETIGIGDGVTTSFTSNLAYTPIKRNNVKLTFTSGDIIYEVEDDGFGILSGTNAEGTIDYTTGAVTINTDIYYQTTETLAVADGVSTEYTYTTLKSDIETNSILIKSIISGTTYTAFDDGLGVISGTAVSGTIDYTTGEIALTYNIAPGEDTNIELIYSYRKTTVPDLDTTIVTAYYFLDGSIEITEAGITNNDGDLLAYATFPPIKFKDYTNHLNMFFMIKKSSFA